MAELKDFEVRLNGEPVHTEELSYRVVGLKLNSPRGEITSIGVEDIDWVDIVLVPLSDLNGPNLQDADLLSRAAKRSWAEENNPVAAVADGGPKSIKSSQTRAEEAPRPEEEKTEEEEVPTLTAPVGSGSKDKK